MAKYRNPLPSVILSNAVILASVFFAILAGVKDDFTLVAGVLFTLKSFLERLFAIDVVHLNVLAPGLPRQNIPAAFVQALELAWRNLKVELVHLRRDHSGRKHYETVANKRMICDSPLRDYSVKRPRPTIW